MGGKSEGSGEGKEGKEEVKGRQKREGLVELVHSSRVSTSLDNIASSYVAMHTFTGRTVQL